MKVCAPASPRDYSPLQAPCKATTPGWETGPGSPPARSQPQKKPPPSGRKSCRSLRPSRLKVRPSCGVPARNLSLPTILRPRRRQAPARLLPLPQLLLRHLLRLLPVAPDDDSDRPVLKRPAAEGATAASAPSPAAAQAEAEADPDRPVLKRGAPTAEELKKRSASVAPSTAAAKDSHKPKASAPEGPIQVIPAISDAAGPDPRPYAYTLKPEEEQKLRKKILLLAADEVRAWAAQPESVARAAGAPLFPARQQSKVSSTHLRRCTVARVRSLQ